MLSLGAQCCCRSPGSKLFLSLGIRTNDYDDPDGRKSKKNDLPLKCVWPNYLQTTLPGLRRMQIFGEGVGSQAYPFPRKRRREFEYTCGFCFRTDTNPGAFIFGHMWKDMFALEKLVSLGGSLAVWPAINTNNFSMAWDKRYAYWVLCIRCTGNRLLLFRGSLVGQGTQCQPWQINITKGEVIWVPLGYIYFNLWTKVVNFNNTFSL